MSSQTPQNNGSSVFREGTCDGGTWGQHHSRGCKSNKFAEHTNLCMRVSARKNERNIKNCIFRASKFFPTQIFSTWFRALISLPVPVLECWVRQCKNCIYFKKSPFPCTFSTLDGVAIAKCAHKKSIQRFLHPLSPPLISPLQIRPALERIIFLFYFSFASCTTHKFSSVQKPPNIIPIEHEKWEKFALFWCSFRFASCHVFRRAALNDSSTEYTFHLFAVEMFFRCFDLFRRIRHRWKPSWLFRFSENKRGIKTRNICFLNKTLISRETVKGLGEMQRTFSWKTFPRSAEIHSIARRKI